MLAPGLQREQPQAVRRLQQHNSVKLLSVNGILETEFQAIHDNATSSSLSMPSSASVDSSGRCWPRVFSESSRKLSAGCKRTTVTQRDTADRLEQTGHSDPGLILGSKYGSASSVTAAADASTGSDSSEVTHCGVADRHQEAKNMECQQRLLSAEAAVHHQCHLLVCAALTSTAASDTRLESMAHLLRELGHLALDVQHAVRGVHVVQHGETC